MELNMKQWMENQVLAAEKKALPVLSFPGTSLLGITVRELCSDADLQAKVMKLVADRVPSAASVSMMDLSVEAEAFGCTARFSDMEVPTVMGALVTDEASAEALEVPAVGAGRTGVYLEAIKKAKDMITDRPVFAGVIGPFSLAGRLADVSEALIMCYDNPDLMHIILKKSAEFLKKYIQAYKDAGANGVVMAEPLTGLLAPALAEEFSEPYVKEIIDAVQDESFIVIYHNCGNGTIRQLDSILRTGASAFHFGNAIDMKTLMEKMPAGIPAMGNVDPVSQFMNGTPQSIAKDTKRIMGECCKYPNFIISSGCDIPPASPWENIDAFFAAVSDFYKAQ